MGLKKYAFIKDSGGILSVDGVIAEIGDQAMPILWLGEGQFCLIPQAVVQNLLELYKELQQTQGDFEYKIPTLRIGWNEGVEIDNQIGRILAGE